VNPEIFNPGIDPNLVRKKYHFENKIILGFVGWFKKWHGLEELIQTYAENKLQKKNICLLLVGDGPAYQDLVAISKQHGVYGEGVVFTGPVDRDDIPRHIAAFDLGLQPDVTEYASPIKLFEYISMGKGVIAPNKENITEILSENYQGLFKTADWQSMGETINTVTESPANIKTLGRETYSLFKQKKYLWVENAKKTIALIQK